MSLLYKWSIIFLSFCFYILGEATLYYIYVHGAQMASLYLYIIFHIKVLVFYNTLYIIREQCSQLFPIYNIYNYIYTNQILQSSIIILRLQYYSCHCDLLKVYNYVI